MEKALKIFGKYFIKLQYAASILSAVSLVLMFVWQCFLRYVLKAPLMGIEELMLLPTIWLYMLGGADASYENSHIECGILTLYIKKEKTKKRFQFVKSLLTFIIFTWLMYWGWKYAVYSFTLWKYTDLLYIPMFFLESAMFVGFALMTIYALRDVVIAVKNLKFKGKED